jgi:peptidoglycan hydrolase-like protein with peptidoglycan-binding domain
LAERVNTLEKPPVPSPSNEEKLRIIQSRLIADGCGLVKVRGKLMQLKEDGQYGSVTAGAIRCYQAKRPDHPPATGILTPQQEDDLLHQTTSPLRPAADTRS